MAELQESATDCMSHFYELLILLHSLDPVQGKSFHRTNELDDGKRQLANLKLHRDYLDSLALLCDYEKGGQTVTAIALQATPQGVVYWVTSNENPKRRIYYFLEKLLKRLSEGAEAAAVESTNAVFGMSVDFSSSRIAKYSSLLRKAIDGCSLSLEPGSVDQVIATHVQGHTISNDDIIDLTAMLSHFRHKDQYRDHHSLCDFAYQNRKSAHMNTLLALAAIYDSYEDPDAPGRQNYRLIRHYLGRLATFKRAALILTDAARQMPYVLLSHTIRVVEPRSLGRRPRLDTTINPALVIEKVLLVSGNAMRETLTQALTAIDHRFDIMTKLRRVAEDKNFKPRVHAELALLEEMCGHEVEFFADDMFIGCSKPACYCCYHYMRLHPSRVALPASHNKIYCNWEPPNESIASASGQIIAGTTRSLGLLQLLGLHLRTRAIEKVSRLSDLSRWHPDSTTGISSSTGPIHSDLPVPDPRNISDHYHLDVSDARPLPEDVCTENDIPLIIACFSHTVLTAAFIFRDDLFETTCDNIRNRNEARVIQDIGRLIVPSPETLTMYGACNLNHLIENVDEAWIKSIPLVSGPRPKPDFSVGLKSAAFTSDQLKKLKSSVGDWKTTSRIVATDEMYFPFLTSEVKCGNEALNVADRQNAHSASVATNAVVELYREVSRVQKLDREVLTFSISHDNETVRIYGHYVSIDGAEIRFYRHAIHKFDITAQDGKEKWTAYKFTRSVYDKFVPMHLERICSAIAQLPDPDAFLVEALSQQSNAESIEQDDSQSNPSHSQESAPRLPSSQMTEPVFKKPKSTGAR